jgi:hypothetical protein
MTKKVGKEGVEPSRLAAHDPKSCLSASSSTSPRNADYSKASLRRSVRVNLYNAGREQTMGRVISTQNLSTERNRLMKAMVIALREMGKQSSFTNESRDLAAFIAAALKTVGETIERSVEPWEKRGYWLKADRFRMDWDWVIPLAQKMTKAVLDEDLNGIAQNAATLGAKLKDVEVPGKHRLGTPWVGVWGKFKAEIK